jgi:antitoxin component YwqK of YwqJK toxin-antitoxin module
MEVFLLSVYALAAIHKYPDKDNIYHKRALKGMEEFPLTSKDRSEAYKSIRDIVPDLDLIDPRLYEQPVDDTCELDGNHRVDIEEINGRKKSTCINMNTSEKDGPEKRWDKNGELTYECTYVNGVKQGLEQSWYGDRISKSFFINGSQEGLMFEYNNGDDIIGFSTWKNNKRNGWWIDYNYRNEYFGSPTKKLLPMSKTWYENGEKNGIGIQWWDNGRIHDILEFRNGYPIGVWKIWDRYHDVFETVTHGEEGRILDIHAETRQRPQEEVEKEKMDERRANGVIDTTPKEKSRRRSGKKSRKKSTIDRNQDI